MALVFQYGSNMSSERLNSADRLNGDAHVVGIAYTEENHELVFDVWSERNECAAASLLVGTGRQIWGVLYEIPDRLIARETAGDRKSLDAIEGQGVNYDRQHITVCYHDGTIVQRPVITYIGRYHREGIETNFEYVKHILTGLQEHKHGIPRQYVKYIRTRIASNNPRLVDLPNGQKKMNGVKRICCVYLVKDGVRIETDKCARAYRNFAASKPRFCDLGDDPSFYCAQRNRANVTWGVCRHNVRQHLAPQDEIYFVACDKTDPHRRKYYFVGFGVVEKCVSHADLYSRPDLKIFRSYFNRLVRPYRGGFEHFELMPKEHWHEDWKMRISSARRTKEIEGDIEFRGCGVSGSQKLSFGTAKERVSAAFPFGENYIVFDKDASIFVPLNPKYICKTTWKKGHKPTSRWTSEKLRSLFSREGKRHREFSNASGKHAAFRLDATKAEGLKRIVARQVTRE